MIKLKSGYKGVHVIHFNDEAPRIGTGRRLVGIVVGRKWAFITDPQMRKVRMRLDKFHELINCKANKGQFPQ